MSGSSDAETKKKDVWQEAGEEFYQESYPSGSGQQNNTQRHQRRSSRHNIPLPSQTARRNSYGIRRKRTYGRDRDRERDTGTNAFTYTSTMAVGTTANDIHVAVMPDLADLSIPNERKRWEELHRIKSMPIPMAQKRELKGQLTTIPMLKLKGWKQVKWRYRQFIDACSTRLTHRWRNFVFWQSSLRDIEVRCGTSIVNVFLFIKWTLFLNVGISAIILAFLILPYLISGGRTEEATECPVPIPTDGNMTRDYTNMSRFDLAQCCREDYYEAGNFSLEPNSTGLLVAIERVFERSRGYEYSPLFYGYYQANEIIYPFTYNYGLAYVLVTATIFAICLVLMVRQVGSGIHELIMAGEGEYYKYCNLIFAGWDHYTRDDAGAKFKKKILRHEMKLALQTEKQKVQKKLRSKKQKWKLFTKRFLAYVFTFILQAIVGYVIYEVTEISIEITQQRELDKRDKTVLAENYQEHYKYSDYELTAISFLPSFLISLVNIIFPNILRIVGKWERYSQESGTAVILIRALFVRLLSIAFVGYRFYTASYCEVEEFTCTTCKASEDIKQRGTCWESLFAEQLYKIIIIDLALKIVIVFGLDIFRVLVGRYIPGKLFKKFGTLKFNIVRHSLDIVYIQSLSWLGFYFAPFIPIVVCIYCVIIFYMKKFTVLVTSQAIPDTFRTTRTTTIFVATKLISFAVVTLVMGMVVGLLEPSKGCGPFREHRIPWEAVTEHVFSNQNSTLDVILEQLASPGVTTPIAIILFLIIYYYYAVAQANRHMVETLRHLLVLEGHDKQYLFARLNTLRGQGQSQNSTMRTGTVLGDD